MERAGALFGGRVPGWSNLHPALLDTTRAHNPPSPQPGPQRALRTQPRPYNVMFVAPRGDRPPHRAPRPGGSAARLRRMAWRHLPPAMGRSPAEPPSPCLSTGEHLAPVERAQQAGPACPGVRMWHAARPCGPSCHTYSTTHTAARTARSAATRALLRARMRPRERPPARRSGGGGRAAPYDWPPPLPLHACAQFRGVTYCKHERAWRARIYTAGRQVHVGR